MELDHSTKNEYGWFVHPFDASQWVYKRLDAEFVGKLFGEDKINLGMPVSGANFMENDFLVFKKVMDCSYGALDININVPNEVALSETVIYNFACKLEDDLFVLNQFNLDKQLFENGGNDDEERLSHNTFLRHIMDMKNNKIYPNNNIQTDEDEEQDNGNE